MGGVREGKEMGEREGQNDYLNELGEGGKKAQNFSEKKVPFTSRNVGSVSRGTWET